MCAFKLINPKEDLKPMNIPSLDYGELNAAKTMNEIFGKDYVPIKEGLFETDMFEPGEYKINDPLGVSENGKLYKLVGSLPPGSSGVAGFVTRAPSSYNPLLAFYRFGETND